MANFIAAYLPYRLWHLFSDEAPNLHSRRNILLYLVICLVSAFTVAWFLAFGLYSFFGLWIEEIYTYVFFNNFGFSVIFGMPLLIILTSDSVSIRCQKPSRHIIFGKINIKKPVCAVYALLMITVFILVFFFHMNPHDAPWLHILSVLSLSGLLCRIRTVSGAIQCDGGYRNASGERAAACSWVNAGDSRYLRMRYR